VQRRDRHRGAVGVTLANTEWDPKAVPELYYLVVAGGGSSTYHEQMLFDESFFVPFWMT
jgi:hypothetical protein